MEKGFMKNFAIIGLGTLINMIISLFTTPIITRLVDPNEYGQLSIFTMYSSIAVMVLCLGLDQALVRYFYKSDDLDYKKHLLLDCVKIPVFSCLVVSILVILTSNLHLFEFEFGLLIIILLCVYTTIQVIFRFSMIIIRLEYNSKLYSKINIILKLLYVICALVLIQIFKTNYLLLLVIATVFSALVCMIISIVTQKKYWNFKTNDTSFEKVPIKELLKYSMPFIISMGLTTLFQAIDKISLNYYQDYSAVGIYSSTMSIVHIFAIIQTTFNTLWMPMAVKHYTFDPEDRSLYIKGNNVITVIMFFIGMSLILVKDVFAILLGSKYREAALILPFLIFNPIMYTISETTVCGLVFKKKSNMQVLVALGACITNIIGNILLVPVIGCKGAAISTGISYIVFFILRTLLSNKYYQINFELKKIFVVTGITCIYALYNTFNRFNIYCLLGYIICILILFILYKNTIIFIIDYVKSFLKKRSRKNENN